MEDLRDLFIEDNILELNRALRQAVADMQLSDEEITYGILLDITE